jgi:hypothetical protein
VVNLPGARGPPWTDGSEASGLARPKAEWAARSIGLKVRKKNF